MGCGVNIREKAGKLAKVCTGHLQSFSILQDDFCGSTGICQYQGKIYILVSWGTVLLEQVNIRNINGKVDILTVLRFVTLAGLVMLQCTVCGYELSKVIFSFFMYCSIVMSVVFWNIIYFTVIWTWIFQGPRLRWDVISILEAENIRIFLLQQIKLVGKPLPSESTFLVLLKCLPVCYVRVFRTE